MNPMPDPDAAARSHYDPRYCATNDPDGYSLDFVFKSGQH